MKYGICYKVTPETIREVKEILELGYDYIEGNAVALSELTMEQIELIAKENIPILAVNLLFPGTFKGDRPMKLVGKEADRAQIANYMEDLFKKLNILNIPTAVFGSGKARAIPEDMDYEEGIKELESICKFIANTAEKYNITVVIEPLSDDAVNTFLTVREGLEMVKKVNHKNMKLLADIYHVFRRNEDINYPDDIFENLYHVHWAEPGTRMIPLKVTPGQKAFAEALKKGGYNKTVSLEAGGHSKEAYIEGLKVLKELFD